MQIQATAAVRRGLTVVVCVCMSAATALAQSVSAPWSSRDIGNPVLAGSASLSNGVFTIEAAGTDIWGTSDQFHFVYQAIAGDVDMRARVDSVSAADAWSKAGVMIRADLTPGSAHAFAVVSAAQGVAFQRRTVAGGVSTSTAGPNAAATALGASRARRHAGHGLQLGGRSDLDGDRSRHHRARRDRVRRARGHQP